MGRTDGTGILPPAGVGPYPPAAPLTGGTSPECALEPFGDRIGAPSQFLRRMLIELELLPGGAADVLVMRTPSSAGTLATALQLGFPGYWPGGGATPYTPYVQLPDGLMVWTVQSPVFVWNSGNGGKAHRFTLGVLPSSVTLTVQLHCLLSAPIQGGLGPQPTCSGPMTINAASPALWIDQ